MATQNLSTGFSKRHLYMVLLMVLTFLVTTEWFLRSYIVTIPKSVPQRIHMVYSSDSPDVAVGDSHIYRSFIDQDLYLNLGRGGSTIPVIDLFIRNYFKYRMPGKVIVEASPQFISEIHLQWHDKNHHQFFNINHWLIPKLYVFEKGIAQEIIRLADPEHATDVIFRRWPDEMKKSRYWSTTIDPQERLDKTRSRVDFQQPLYGSPAAENYFRIYQEMLEFLQAKGARICVLRTPVDPNYLAMIASRDPYQKTISRFKDIAKSLGLKYVDFRELDMSFEFAAFINQDHLMPDQSRQFVELADQACYQ
ncbi:hypothetical protein ACFODZ_12410 [Marinicella sediminis]|uniref:DUF1574 domain-containing protein n=1 Tax=Marinicella sediminis TaxID=1792834 RepID=A0ABV7JA98_9GAMM|nr:hypothetical protein [Marinicella sediminis]